MFVVHDILAFIATVQWHKNALSLIIIPLFTIDSQRMYC